MPERCRAAQRCTEKDDRGAALVEFALVFVVLFTIVFGLIEGGLMVRARNTIDNAADDAARRGSVAADDPLADWMILQQLRARGAIAAATINYVVVYRGDNGTQGPTATCRAGTPVLGECNVYDRTEFDESSAAFGCVSLDLDANWCPTDRSTDSGTFEYLGVLVDASHNGLLGIFNDFDIDIVGNSALPLEAGDVR